MNFLISSATKPIFTLVRQKLFFSFCLFLFLESAHAMITPQDFFNRLNKNTMNLVDEFYHPDVVFEDPVAHLTGPAQIKKHYAHQYENLKSIRWDFSSQMREGDKFCFEWIMTLAHPALNSGKEFSVKGSSVMRFASNGQVIYHRDYFDMGDFVYSQIPGLRWIHSKIKNSLRSEN